MHRTLCLTAVSGAFRSTPRLFASTLQPSPKIAFTHAATTTPTPTPAASESTDETTTRGPSRASLRKAYLRQHFPPPHRLRLPNILFRMLPSHKSNDGGHQVCFRVPLNLNKIQIRNYLEELYQVKIENVSTTIVLGKRTINPRTRQPDKKPDIKKAFVTLSTPFKYPDWAQVRLWSGHDPETVEAEEIERQVALEESGRKAKSKKTNKAEE